MKMKAELRKEILSLRDSLTTKERQQKSREIARKVIQQKKFQEADKILLFVSFRSEVDTRSIFQAARDMGKEVYFPKVEGKEMAFYRVEKESDLVEGYRGIWEPHGKDDTRFEVVENVEREKKEFRILVIMPGVAFDPKGSRIGYGGGYYDRYLQKLEDHRMKENLYKLAIAFQCQIVETGRIISEPYDVKPNMIITEETEYTM